LKTRGWFERYRSVSRSIDPRYDGGRSEPEELGS